jgi:hypothetical protein
MFKKYKTFDIRNMNGEYYDGNGSFLEIMKNDSCVAIKFPLVNDSIIHYNKIEDNVWHSTICTDWYKSGIVYKSLPSKVPSVYDIYVINDTIVEFCTCYCRSLGDKNWDKIYKLYVKVADTLYSIYDDKTIIKCKKAPSAKVLNETIRDAIDKNCNIKIYNLIYVNGQYAYEFNIKKGVKDTICTKINNADLIRIIPGIKNFISLEDGKRILYKEFWGTSTCSPK